MKRLLTPEEAQLLIPQQKFIKIGKKVVFPRGATACIKAKSMTIGFDGENIGDLFYYTKKGIYKLGQEKNFLPYLRKKSKLPTRYDRLYGELEKLLP